MIREIIYSCTGFDWDEGNSEKNWIRHKVTKYECEEIFFNQPLIVADDLKHSQQETRYYTLGRTDANRLLFIVFTIREKKVRVISARDMNEKERKKYEKRI